MQKKTWQMSTVAAMTPAQQQLALMHARPSKARTNNFPDTDRPYEKATVQKTHASKHVNNVSETRLGICRTSRPTHVRLMIRSFKELHCLMVVHMFGYDQLEDCH